MATHIPSRWRGQGPPCANAGSPGTSLGASSSGTQVEAFQMWVLPAIPAPPTSRSFFSEFAGEHIFFWAILWDLSGDFKFGLWAEAEVPRGMPRREGLQESSLRPARWKPSLGTLIGWLCFETPSGFMALMLPSVAFLQGALLPNPHHFASFSFLPQPSAATTLNSPHL